MSVTASIATVNRPSFLTTLSSILTSNKKGLIDQLHIVYLPDMEDFVNCDLARHIYSVLEWEGMRIKQIRQSNYGIGKARAIQLAEGRTRYLLTLDDDVVLQKNCLSELYSTFTMQKDATAIMPLMLSNYDPNKQLGKTFIDMKMRHIDGADFETNSFTHVLFPFMNVVWNTYKPQEYDILYAICCMIDMTKFKKEPAIEILKKWNPHKGYEDRWFGKYLLSQGCKLFVQPNAYCYHFMSPSESRHWNTEIDCDKELELLDNLLNNPFLE